MAVCDPIPVIDLFAGSGGLGEGFSAAHFQGQRIFRIALSIEKDPHAHATLMLRGFFRQFTGRCVPEAYYEHLRGELSRDDLYARYPAEAQRAAQEAWQAELGGASVPPDIVLQRIRQSLAGAKAWVLIGGPPCQAYSIANQSRRRRTRGYSIEQDSRHRLYEEYLRIVADLWPPVFVMENVKGLLSTTIRGERLFERICDDLSDPARNRLGQKRRRYRILGLGERVERSPFGGNSVQNFVIRAERHGIPQTRHRVILLGIREDLGDIILPALRSQEAVPADAVLQGLPRLRSGLSRKGGRLSMSADNPGAWRAVLRGEIKGRWVDGIQGSDNRDSIHAVVVLIIVWLSCHFQEHDRESRRFWDY